MHHAGLRSETTENCLCSPGILARGQSEVAVRQAVSGAAYVEIRDVGPSEALVLVNRP